MVNEILVAGVAALAILFGGFLKGATGMGAPLVAIPVLASIYSVPTAIAVMTVPLVVSNVWQMWTYRRAQEGRGALRLLLLGCVAGVILGTFLLGLLHEAWLAVGLAALVFLYLGLRIAQPEMKLAAPGARRAALPVGVVTGLLQGAAGMSTPVSVTFIHAQQLPREAYVFAVSAMFTVLAATQLLALSVAGLMPSHLALASAAALLPIMSGVWFGQHLGRRFSQSTFEKLTFVVLTIIGLALLAKAVPALVA